MARRRTWTDEDLIAAIDGASSISEVVRQLRLSHGGAAFVTVRARIEQLGLEPPSRKRARRDPQPTAASRERTDRGRRRWSDHELRAAVAGSSSLRQVFLALGLAVGGSQWAVVRARIKHLDCDTSHWDHPLDPPRAITHAGAVEVLMAADLPRLLSRCRSRAELLRSVGLTPSATTYRALRRVLEVSDIRGDVPALQRPPGRRRRSLEEILVRDSDWTNTARLRERLIEEGLREARCEACGLDRWRGEPAPLQLDHIDGDRRNNLIDNLRILCANCHALTATWCSRNRGHDGQGEEATR